MLDRRSVLAGLFAFTAAVPLGVVEEADAARRSRRVRRKIRRSLRRRVRRKARRRKKKPFRLAKKFEPRTVRFRGYKPGTIVVDPKRHYLYLVESRSRARRYGVGVGRAGLEFTGKARIGYKREWPKWTPTREMIEREPEKYAKYADGVPGGPGNPLGARALYLFQGKKDTLFRIHGTTAPWSIGRSVSNGCIRMLNRHVEDLYERVKVGARVIVL